jgi:hypothetical protein
MCKWNDEKSLQIWKECVANLSLEDVLLLQGIIEIGSYINDKSGIWLRFNPKSDVSSNTLATNIYETTLRFAKCCMV